MIQSLTQHFQAFTVEIVRLSLWLAILSLVFIPLERLFPLHRRGVARRQIGNDAAYYFISGIVPALLMSVPLGIVAWMAHRLIPSGILTAVAGAPFWARALSTFLAMEVGYYWGHRWTHEIPFLWRFHAVHHSAREIDFLVSTHAHPVDTAFSHMCSMIPIYALGLSAPAAESGSVLIVLLNLTAQCWGYFLHANLRVRLGPLEWLIATPAFHHWHHTLHAPLNQNFSAMLPWLDRLFGTHHLPKAAWPAAYGITAPMPESLSGQLTQPLAGRRASPVI